MRHTESLLLKLRVVMQLWIPLTRGFTNCTVSRMELENIVQVASLVLNLPIVARYSIAAPIVDDEFELLSDFDIDGN